MVLWCGFIHAQEFEYIEIGGIYGGITQLSNSYSDRWSTTNPYGLVVRTPYYFGEIGLSVYWFDFEPLTPETERFNTTNFEATFSFDVLRSPLISLKPITGIGIQRSERVIENGSNLFERELIAIGELEAGVRIKSVILYSRFGYRRIYNFERQHTLTIGIGARYRFNLSKSFQDFIR